MKPGTTISHFELTEKIGEGGMGVVWKARDTKLARDVALKILAADTAADPGRLARFARETKAIAALNHPNIVTIYSVDELVDTHFFTMELVQGKPLDEAGLEGGLALRKFLDYATQLVDAVSAAHDRGIVHRDLKPTNVMVTDDGRLKVLDFGLAKLRGGSESKLADSGLSTASITQEGMILGTVAYMSPEQAEGRVVDERSDIFTLGILMYQMATGRQPFRGDTAVSVISSILKDEAKPLSRYRANYPREIERIVTLCLVKDVDRRFQSARDIRIQLVQLRDELSSGQYQQKTIGEAEPTRGRRGRRGWKWLGAAAAVAAAFVLGTSLSGPVEVTGKQASLGGTLSAITSHGDFSGYPSWSPDGESVVFASYSEGSMDLFKKSLEGGQPVRLTFGPDDEIEPSWSPDGKTIAFFSSLGGGGIFLIGNEGGTPWQLTDFGTGPRWSPDGQSIAFESNGAIYLMPPDGRDPVRVVAPTSASPQAIWSQDSTRLVFWNRAGGDIYVVSRQGGEATSLRLIDAGMEAGGLSLSGDGARLFFSQGPFGGAKDIWSVEVDPATQLPRGEAVRLTLSPTDDVDGSVSPDGTRVAFAARTVERNLWTLPLDRETGLVNGEAVQLTSLGQHNQYPAVSRDGSKVAWTSHQAGRGLIYFRAGGAAGGVKLTREWDRSSREVGVSFAPDGERIIYSSTVGGSYQLWRKPCLTCVEFQVTRTSHPHRDVHPSWSPTGDLVAFFSNRAGNWDLWLVDPETDVEPRQLTTMPGNELYPAWSPSGQEIAFRNEAGETPDIWLVDRDGSNPRPWISTAGEDAWATWSADGERVYFASNLKGPFDIWVIDSEGEGRPVRVTSYEEMSFGLPESALMTEFAVDADRLVLPLESRQAEVYLLELDPGDP